MDNPIIHSNLFFPGKFADYEEIIRAEPVQELYFKKGQTITEYGKINNHALFIKSGIMHLALGHPEGGEKSIAFFGAGSIFPVGMNHHNYKEEHEMIMRAFSDIQVLRFPYLTLRKIALENPALAIGLLEFDCEFIGHLFSDAINTTFETGQTRVCDLLYQYYIYTEWPDHETTITQSTLASIAGVSRAQMERTIKLLREQGAIRTARNSIKVVNLETLLQFCSIGTKEKHDNSKKMVPLVE